jgi:hypothetical protein
MKKKHLWYLIPIAFAMIFSELIENRMNLSLAILSLACMVYTFFIALNKPD